MNAGAHARPSDVREALAHARRLGLDRLDAQLLVAAALGRDRTWVLAHDDVLLDRDSAARLADWIDRRAAGEPLAYLVGRREFHGLDLAVGPDVLVPRPDTETLVDWALEPAVASTLAPIHAGSPRVVDLGTGSGAIALALKAARPGWDVRATDASAAALAVAADNARRLGLPLTLHAGSWWQALPAQLRFDLAVSNPPYIPAGDPHLAALRHEPAAALVAGADGLDDLRTLIAGAPARLNPGAWLLLEHGHDQSSAVAGLLEETGFCNVQTRRDLGGHVRCTGAIWPPNPRPNGNSWPHKPIRAA